MRSAQIAQLYPRSPLAQGIVAAYDFQSQIGTTVFDVSGNGNTGQWVGTLGSQWGPGKIGGGGVFNGTNNYVNMGNVLQVGLSDWSVNVWFKTSATAPPAVYGIIVKSSAESLLGRWGLFLDPGSGYALTTVFQYSGSLNGSISTPFTADGNWHMGTMTAKRNGLETLYLDGKSRATLDISAGAATNMNAARSVLVGAYLAAGGVSVLAGSYFPGAIDEPTIWSGRALTPNDVAQLFALGQGKAYPFI